MLTASCAWSCFFFSFSVPHAQAQARTRTPRGLSFSTIHGLVSFWRNGDMESRGLISSSERLLESDEATSSKQADKPQGDR